MGGKVATALALGLALAFGGAAAAGPHDMLVAAGPPRIARGAVRIGDTLLTLPVRHAMTGRLANRVTIDSVFTRDPPLEIGQPVFAAPAANGMAWCAPRLKPDGRTWQSACLTPSHAGLYEWEVRRRPAMAPSDLGHVDMASSGQASVAPVVRRGSVPLPPMTLTVVLKSVSPDQGLCDLELDLDWGEGPQAYGHMSVTASPHGGTARVMGVRLQLTPGSDPGEVRVSQPWAWPIP